MDKTRLILMGLGLAALVVLPFLVGEFWISMMVQILVFGLFALSVDLLIGHAGLFSLCHASFFAVAAYTTAILHVRYEAITLVAAPAGILAAILLALIFGLAVRTRGVYFILVTIALGYIIWGITYRWSSFTGGDNGVTNVPFPALGSWAVTSLREYYFLVLVVLGFCLWGYWVLVNSPFGLTLRGIKGSETRMRSLGFNVTAHLYAGFVLSGAMAGLAGVLYIYYNRFVNPATAAFPMSVEAALMAIIGGSGTLLGSFLGSALILCLRNWVSSFFEQYMAIMGLVFIGTVLWVPGGIMGLARRLLERRQGEQSDGPRDGQDEQSSPERAAA